MKCLGCGTVFIDGPVNTQCITCGSVGRWMADSFPDQAEGSCTCPTECDCEAPEGNPRLVSNHCPEHTENPYPYPDCPVHGAEPEDDGQPDEAQEWADYDKDC